LTDLIVLIASVRELGRWVYLLAAGSGSRGAGEALAGFLGILSVAGAWTVVHAVFTLRYALLNYAGPRAGFISTNAVNPVTAAKPGHGRVPR
jgi:uncharacterized membrane protein